MTRSTFQDTCSSSSIRVVCEALSSRSAHQLSCSHHARLANPSLQPIHSYRIRPCRFRMCLSAIPTTPVSPIHLAWPCVRNLRFPKLLEFSPGKKPGVSSIEARGADSKEISYVIAELTTSSYQRRHICNRLYTPCASDHNACNNRSAPGVCAWIEYRAIGSYVYDKTRAPAIVKVYATKRV